MAKTFLELLADLQEASNEKEALRITNSLSELLEEDDSYTKYFLHNVFNAVTFRNFEKDFVSFVSDEFCDIQVASYFDDDYKTKVAVMFVFLHDYENPSETIDEEVMEDILRTLEESNLQFLVNDISVNVSQVRNGKKVAYDNLLV